jgi:hypothetical protein
MRCAAGQAVFCEALVDHVFCLFYVPRSFKEAAEQMLEFFEDNRK